MEKGILDFGTAAISLISTFLNLTPSYSQKKKEEYFKLSKELLDLENELKEYWSLNNNAPDYNFIMQIKGQISNKASEIALFLSVFNEELKSGNYKCVLEVKDA